MTKSHFLPLLNCKFWKTICTNGSESNNFVVLKSNGFVVLKSNGFASLKSNSYSTFGAAISKKGSIHSIPTQDDFQQNQSLNVASSRQELEQVEKEKLTNVNILRPYQKECIEKSLEEYKNGLRRMAVSLPVGSGKTQLQAPTERAQKTLVLAHREELLLQAQRQIKKAAPHLKVSIECADRYSDVESDGVIVASVATLGRIGSGQERLSRFHPADFKAIIIDEAHHSVADSYMRIIEHFIGSNVSGNLKLKDLKEPDRDFQSKKLNQSFSAASQMGKNIGSVEKCTALNETDSDYFDCDKGILTNNCTDKRAFPYKNSLPNACQADRSTADLASHQSTNNKGLLSLKEVDSSRGSHIMIWGCSATFSRRDDRALGLLFEKVLYHMDIGRAIREGWLVKAETRQIYTQLDLDSVPLQKNRISGERDFDSAVLSLAIDTPGRNQLVAATWYNVAWMEKKCKSTIVFALNVQHVMNLAQAFLMIHLSQDDRLDRNCLKSCTADQKNEPFLEEMADFHSDSKLSISKDLLGRKVTEKKSQERLLCVDLKIGKGLADDNHTIGPLLTGRADINYSESNENANFNEGNLLDENGKEEKVQEEALNQPESLSKLIFEQDCLNALKDERHFFLQKFRVAVVTGETGAREREHILAEYSAGRIQVLINCAVLTEGTDIPRTDCIVMTRPTCNANIYTQMVGRGLRLHPEKDSCLVLDFVDRSRGVNRSLVTFPSLVQYQSSSSKIKNEITNGTIEDLEDGDQDDLNLPLKKGEKKGKSGRVVKEIDLEKLQVCCVDPAERTGDEEASIHFDYEAREPAASPGFGLAWIQISNRTFAINSQKMAILLRVSAKDASNGRLQLVQYANRRTWQTTPLFLDSKGRCVDQSCNGLENEGLRDHVHFEDEPIHLLIPKLLLYLKEEGALEGMRVDAYWRRRRPPSTMQKRMLLAILDQMAKATNANYTVSQGKGDSNSFSKKNVGLAKSSGNEGKGLDLLKDASPISKVDRAFVFTSSVGRASDLIFKHLILSRFKIAPLPSSVPSLLLGVHCY